MNLQELPDSGDAVEPANENSLLLDWSTIYGKDPTTTAGLTWGYHGTPTDGAQEGRWGGFEVAAGTFTLADDSTNYIVVLRSTGAISCSATSTNWDNTTDYARVYKVTTVSGAVTAVEDHRAGPNGVIGGADGADGAAGADGDTALQGLTFTSDTGSTADSDPGAGLFKWNNATQSSATVLYFDDATADAISMTTFWASLGSSGFIHLQQSDDATKWQLWKWTATPTDGTGYRKFTVTLQASGGAIADAKTVYCLFLPAGSGSGSGAIAARVTNATQSIAQNGVALSFDTEVRDDGGLFDAGSPTRLTAPSDGWYNITASANCAADSDGGRRLLLRLDGTTEIARQSVAAPASMNDPAIAVSTNIYLTTGQYAEAFLSQNAGGNLTITNAHFSMVKWPFS